MKLSESAVNAKMVLAFKMKNRSNKSRIQRIESFEIFTLQGLPETIKMEYVYLKIVEKTLNTYSSKSWIYKL